MSVFVDTNILLYAVSNSEDEADKAKVARATLEAGNWKLSVQVLQEFYVNAVRKIATPLNERRAFKFIQHLSRSEPLPVDLRLMLNGIRVARRYRLSYWDGAIVAAAQLSHCETLLTEDLSHGQDYGGVKAINPFRIS